MPPRSRGSAELGRRLREARNADNVPQQDLAGVAGINVANYAKIERGLGNPTFETIVRLASALGRDPGEFVAGISADDLPATKQTYTVREFRQERQRRTDL